MRVSDRMGVSDRMRVSDLIRPNSLCSNIRNVYDHYMYLLSLSPDARCPQAADGQEQELLRPYHRGFFLPQLGLPGELLMGWGCGTTDDGMGVWHC